MIGILLAAGFSRRFGAQDKLLQTLPDGRLMAIAAAQNLINALPNSVAVVRVDNQALAALLKNIGFKLVFCDTNATEMADSLVAAIRDIKPMPEAQTGCVIALADMPFMQTATIQKVAQTLQNGADIVLPIYQQQRGHPVGFAAKYYDELLKVKGDEGARSVVKRYADRVTLVDCNDAGILQDIDTQADLIKISANLS